VVAAAPYGGGGLDPSVVGPPTGTLSVSSTSCSTLRILEISAQVIWFRSPRVGGAFTPEPALCPVLIPCRVAARHGRHRYRSYSGGMRSR
jgi:hypothetical protein